MYAIVEIAGKQYKVRENDKLIVPRLSGEADDSVTFDRVLLVANDDDVQLGTPVVPNASVTATIVEHVKGDKVLVFRKKRRKRFKVKRGHRQPYTRIEVSDLSVDGETTKKKEKTTGKKDVKTEVSAKADTDQAETEPKPTKRSRAKTAPEAGKSETASKSEKPSKGEQASETKKPSKAEKKATGDEDAGSSDPAEEKGSS